MSTRARQLAAIASYRKKVTGADAGSAHHGYLPLHTPEPSSIHTLEDFRRALHPDRVLTCGGGLTPAHDDHEGPSAA